MDFRHLQFHVKAKVICILREISWQRDHREGQRDEIKFQSFFCYQQLCSRSSNDSPVCFAPAEAKTWEGKWLIWTEHEMLCWVDLIGSSGYLYRSTVFPIIRAARGSAGWCRAMLEIVIGNVITLLHEVSLLKLLIAYRRLSLFLLLVIKCWIF